MNTLGTLGLLSGFIGGLSMLLFPRLRIAGVVIAGVVIAIAFVLHQRYASAMLAFQNLPLDISEQTLVAVAGPSSRVTDGSEWVEPGVKRSSTELISGCTREYWYSYFFLPDAVSFCFSHQGKLVHKSRYSSW
ncbi:MAG: hypothetical protein EOP50_06140 [Sphingobacteriales bacterium]|nr:MAG: hypothetical protein EOP50_06140 [Sphingobacteriales bacterium]